MDFIIRVFNVVVVFWL